MTSINYLNERIFYCILRNNWNLYFSAI